MRIALISRDEALLPLCKGVVNKLALDHCEVSLAGPDQSVDADIYIWDMDCKPHIPFLGDRPAATDIFLVRRSAVTAFLNRFPEARPSMLLKPVSPAALEVHLTHTVSCHTDSNRRTDLDQIRTDRDTLLDCLLHSTLRLQEFEEDRTNFWARAAHDLRAPLTAASGYCGLLLESQAGPLNEGQQDLLQRIQHSLKKLNRMASAMFHLTAGRQLEGKYELKRTNIEEAIRRSIDEVQIFALEKNLALDFEIANPGQALYVEPNQIEQVLVNLLENACKFTPRNGSIKVRAYPVPWSTQPMAVDGLLSSEADTSKTPFTGYRVDVCDSGPGIAPEHLQNIFEEYVSYGNTADRSGGGLGLAICKMILRAHHGEIWAEAGAQGTTLSFVLPFSQSMTEDHEPVAFTRV